MRKNKLGDNLKRRFRKYLNYILLILAVFLTLSLIRSVDRIRSATGEISKAEKRVSELKSENESLKERLEKVQSEEYVELQLREKLGLAKEGEIVIVLPEDEVLRKFAPEPDQDEEGLPEPNWKVWFNLFL